MARLVVGVLQRARREEAVVGRVERYRPELLPVPHVRVLGQNLVQRNLSLWLNAVRRAPRKIPRTYVPLGDAQ
jgi:hypothetical protein